MKAEPAPDTGNGRLEALGRLVEDSPAVLFLWRIEPGNWSVEAVSAGVQGLLGYTVEEFTSGSVSWPAITHPQDAPRLEREVQEFLAAGRDEWSQQYRLTAKDGRTIWVEGRNRVVRDADGQPTHIHAFVIDIIERKRAEAALRASEERLRRSADTFQRLIEDNPMGLYVVDADLKMLYASRGAHRAFQYMPPPLIGRRLDECLRAMWPEPFASEAIERFRHTLATGEPFRAPSTVARRRDIGDVEAYDWQLERITLPDDRPGVVCYYYDLSERNALESALRASEERFRSMFEQVPLGVAIVDSLNARFCMVNPAFARITGWSVEELERMDWVKITHPDDIRGDKDRMAAMNAGKIPGFQMEKRYRRPDGSYFWISITVAPMSVTDKMHPRHLLMLEDIDVRKRMEKALRQLNTTLEQRVAERTEELQESETRFRTIFDTAADGLILREAKNGRFALANAACLDMLGYTLDEFRALRLEDLHPEEELPFIRGEIAKFNKGGAAPRGEVRFRGKDGRLFVVEINPTAMRLGGVEYVLLAMRDVTQRKEAEVALACANRALRAISVCNDAILHAHNETELFRDVCRTVVEVGSYRLAWVGLAEHDPRKTVRPVAHAGFADHLLAAIRITWSTGPRGRGPLATAIRTRKPALIRDVTKKSAYLPYRRFLRAHGCVAALGLPLVADGQCIGALGIFAAEGTAFDASEVSLLTRLADDVAFGVQALRARAARRRLETQVLEISEREQRRIGQDLHDSLAQRIVAARIHCEATAQQLAREKLPAAQDIAKAIDQLTQAVEETRQIARGLHPVHSGADSLMAAVQELADNVTKMFHIPCRFFCPRRVLVQDHGAATHLYRIAQEAANNAARHGHPKHIRIGLAAVNGGVRLRIEDDGCGLSATAGASTGLGLGIMKYRASVIGATLAINPCRRRGTVVICEWKPARKETHAR